MRKNRIVTIILFLILCIPVLAEEPVMPAANPAVQEETFEQIKANSNVVQEQAAQEKISYKQPVSKRKIAKKFLLAMGGVVDSSIRQLLILSLYNKIREGFVTPEGIGEKEETMLETPDNTVDAVRTFLDKTKY